MEFLNPIRYTIGLSQECKDGFTLNNLFMQSQWLIKGEKAYNHFNKQRKDVKIL